MYVHINSSSKSNLIGLSCVQKVITQIASKQQSTPNLQSNSPASPSSLSLTVAPPNPTSAFDQAVLKLLKQPLSDIVRDRLKDVHDLDSLSVVLDLPNDQARHEDFLDKLQAQGVELEFFEINTNVEEIYFCLVELGVKKVDAAKAARFIFCVLHP